MRVLGYSGMHRSMQVKQRQFPSLDSRIHRFSQGYDSAAALLVDGIVVAAAAEERFTGDKTTGAFPVNAIRYCLQQGDLKIDEIDKLAHGFAYAPGSLHEKDEYSRMRYRTIYSVDAQIGWAEEFFPGPEWSERFEPVPHHLAHAASSFFPSGFSDALVVVSDGMGESDSLRGLCETQFEEV
jgi:carbamoyltransferase